MAEAAERHARLQLAETSPADKATVTLAVYMETFLGSHDIEACHDISTLISANMPTMSALTIQEASCNGIIPLTFTA